MRIEVEQIDDFIKGLEERGYRRGNSFHHQYKPEHSLWKSFHRGEDKCEHKGYQICIGIWDQTKYHSTAGVSISFDMMMNHQTPIQVDRLDIHMMEDSMDVAEFERRCEALWCAMKDIMPRKTKEPTA